MGPYIPNIPYQQPTIGMSNVFPITAPQGGSNYQPGWAQLESTYAPRDPQNFSNVPLARGFNPSQQGGYAMPYTNQSQMGGYTQFLNHMGQNPQKGLYLYVNNPYSGIPYVGSSLDINPYPFNQSFHNPFSLTKLPILDTLELPYLSKLTNNPIRHYFAWPPVPVNIPIDIPKFNGKTGEDPTNHITTYLLWCVSNSFLDDSIKLRLFPRTLTGNMAKWFIELPTSSFFDFQCMAISFLMHFQLPIWYETGTKLLTSLLQNTTTHIVNHIHEWRRCKRLVKSPIPDALLAYWFTKSLFPKISCDVAMSRVFTEEDVI